ncbi:MAG TPA: hypothetical protein VN969_10775 [Streptosporangiaceae bacterium]|nr:hypothetical protein [Streptosporangiaceae bacterium]
MARQQPLIERIADRRPLLDLLISDFGRFVDTFDATRQFSGPSVYFHVKALRVLQSHDNAVDALADEAYFDYLYATLASWGLHRMGPGNTKLVEIAELRSSFQQQREHIERLQHLRIEDISDSNVDEVTSLIWNVLMKLRVGVGETLLVANSKALHHLLPQLVPPIDRNYTLMFFVGRPYVYRGRDRDYFAALFPLFREIAVRCRKDIERRINDPWIGMNTSFTKVIDNAILGFVPLQDPSNSQKPGFTEDSG